MRPYPAPFVLHHPRAVIRTAEAQKIVEDRSMMGSFGHELRAGLVYDFLNRLEINNFNDSHLDWYEMRKDSRKTEAANLKLSLPSSPSEETEKERLPERHCYSRIKMEPTRAYNANGAWRYSKVLAYHTSVWIYNWSRGKGRRVGVHPKCAEGLRHKFSRIGLRFLCGAPSSFGHLDVDSIKVNKGSNNHGASAICVFMDALHPHRSLLALPLYIVRRIRKNLKQDASIRINETLAAS